MKTFYKILGVIFLLGFLGQSLIGNFPIWLLLFGIIFIYLGLRNKNDKPKTTPTKNDSYLGTKYKEIIQSLQLISSAPPTITNNLENTNWSAFYEKLHLTYYFRPSNRLIISESGLANEVYYEKLEDNSLLIRNHDTVLYKYHIIEKYFLVLINEQTKNTIPLISSTVKNSHYAPNIYYLNKLISYLENNKLTPDDKLMVVQVCDLGIVLIKGVNFTRAIKLSNYLVKNHDSGKFVLDYFDSIFEKTFRQMINNSNFRYKHKLAVAEPFFIHGILTRN